MRVQFKVPFFGFCPGGHHHSTSTSVFTPLNTDNCRHNCIDICGTNTDTRHTTTVKLLLLQMYL